MRTAQAENPEARRVRERADAKRYQAACDRWCAQRTQKLREARANLPPARYNAFIATALQTRHNVEAILAGAGETPSRFTMAWARAGLDEELQAIADMRGGQKQDEFAGPDEEEEVFGEAEQRF